MSKFLFPCYDHDFSLGEKNGCVNGGSVWCYHMARALQQLGHKAELINTYDKETKGDVMICQSEWTYGDAWKNFKGTKVCLLGHFRKGVYIDPELIKADLFLTTWRGETVAGFDAHYFPHAYAKSSDNGLTKFSGRVVWLGNKYCLRDQDWFKGLPVDYLRGKHPSDLSSIYRGADVCPNIHGDFQKNLVCDDPARVSDKLGMAHNERFYHVVGAGGVMVTDAHPLNHEVFPPEELIEAEDKDDFRIKTMYYQAHPEDGRKFYEKARKRILAKHTYIHRMKFLLALLNQ